MPQSTTYALQTCTNTHYLQVTPQNTIFREEVFGPVMSITTFKTVDEALELANSSSYGLGEYMLFFQ